jgi:tetratricopeptide (TPR) repeat protein
VAYFNQNRWPEALAAFQDAVRANPDNAEAHYNLGALYRLMNDNVRTHAQLEILSRLNRDLWAQLAGFVYTPRKLKLSE